MSPRDETASRQVAAVVSLLREKMDSALSEGEYRDFDRAVFGSTTGWTAKFVKGKAKNRPKLETVFAVLAQLELDAGAFMAEALAETKSIKAGAEQAVAEFRGQWAAAEATWTRLEPRVRAVVQEEIKEELRKRDG